MSSIHETAKLTSKGQITLPKPIRQTLGVAAGGMVAFDLRNGKVVVTRAEEDRQSDPAIEAFLALLERDMRAGKNIQTLPASLVKAMRKSAKLKLNPDAEIDGEVAI